MDRVGGKKGRMALQRLLRIDGLDVVCLNVRFDEIGRVANDENLRQHDLE